MSHSEKTYGQTRGQTDYRADGQMERQTFFHRTLPAMSGCPTKETTKEVSDQTLLGNFKHCKSYLLEIGMIQGGQDVAYVRSLWNFLKLMIMITHIKMMQMPILTYGQCFSQKVPHTSYASHFFGMFKDML